MKTTRREFLNSMMISGMMYGSVLKYFTRKAYAQSAPTDPMLVHINLTGGADFRHLLPPPPSSNTSSYGYHHWNARARAHRISNSISAWNSRWNSFTPISSGGTNFGIFSQADWLIEQWNAGNVAIINNVYGSSNRDHHHSQIIWESGAMNAGKNDSDRDGFGGRLANLADVNVISVTSHTRQFCYQPNPDNPASHLSTRTIAAPDTRDMGLYRSSQLIENPASGHAKAIMERSLKAYYASKSSAISDTSPFKRFVDQERGLREFDAAMRAALADVSIPTAISSLYEGNSTLSWTNFGRQIRNVYDAVAAQSVLDFRIASMEYRGWDTHRTQGSDIENYYSDLFGSNGGLATLTSELEDNYGDALNNMVFMLGGEFGRQLADNGDAGTDHGVGMSVILIGNRVNGGIYGEMFPESEIADSPNGYLRGNSDIQGRTSIETLYQRVANFFHGTTATGIVPGTADGATDIEEAGLLDDLFS